jgi:hypothetical protein
MSEYTIECRDCASGDAAHRSDCLVALLEDLDAEPGDPIVFDDAELRALRALRSGGLLPPTTVLPSDEELRSTGS